MRNAAYLYQNNKYKIKNYINNLYKIENNQDIILLIFNYN